MTKSESKELGANRRPSARRASRDSELPASESTGTIAKRAHARRANAEPGSELSGEPLASVAEEDHTQSTETPTPGEGIAFAPQPSAAPSSVPPARARARRPRAKQTSKVSGAQPPAAADVPRAAPPTAAAELSPAPAAGDVPRAAPPTAAVELSPAPTAADVPRAAPPTAAAELSPAPAAADVPRAAPPTAAAELSPAPAAGDVLRAAPPTAAAELSPAPAAADVPRAAPPTAAAELSPAPAAADVPRAAPPTAAADLSPAPADHAARETQREPVTWEAPASIVEAASWSGSLQQAEDVTPPSLEHADFADDFGLDVQYETKLRPWLDSLCERHFHVELHGAQNIPAHGRALLVANHSRASVWDGIVLRAALRLHHPAGRMPRWLVDDQQFHAPFLGTIVNRLGAVRACQENAERLLLREELVAVFPEGSKATDRPYEERYRLQRFGRGGYVKLALRTGTPVLPVAIVATEHEGAVWRNRLANASRVLAAPFAALRPGLPRIGKLGVPPISARIRIYVGAAVAEISRQDASVTQDDGVVHELNECVRSAIQNLVNASLHP